MSKYEFISSRGAIDTKHNTITADSDVIAAFIAVTTAIIELKKGFDSWTLNNIETGKMVIKFESSDDPNVGFVLLDENNKRI